VHSLLKKLARFLVLGVLFFRICERKIRIDRWPRVVLSRR
jgi:hypothetical protein